MNTRTPPPEAAAKLRELIAPRVEAGDGWAINALMRLELAEDEDAEALAILTEFVAQYREQIGRAMVNIGEAFAALGRSIGTAADRRDAIDVAAVPDHRKELLSDTSESEATCD